MELLFIELWVPPGQHRDLYNTRVEYPEEIKYELKSTSIQQFLLLPVIHCMKCVFLLRSIYIVKGTQVLTTCYLLRVRITNYIIWLRTFSVSLTYHF